MTSEYNQGMLIVTKSTSAISNDLWDLYNNYKTGELGTEPYPSQFRSSNDYMQFGEDNSSVLVKITSGNVEGLMPSLENMGFKTVGKAQEYNFVEGFVQIASIPYMESLKSVGMMGVMSAPKPYRNVGLVTSQADVIEETQRVRASLPNGFDGTGVRIGVLSDSYNVSGDGSAAQDIATGDLPASGVIVLQEGPSGSTDEGRGMLQLVHDLAPGSSLAFASAFFGEANFAQQIRNLADPNQGNADIIVDDIIYFAEPFFQDGIVAQAVDDVVTNRGAAYFSAAGNFARNSYESTNFGATTDSVGLIGGLYHDFDPGAGVDTRQLLTLNPGANRISLQWDDPFYTTNGVDTDLDIYLVEAGTNNILLRFEADNIQNQTPFELAGFNLGGTTPLQAELMIRLYAGPAPERIKYLNLNRFRIEEFDTQSSTIFGHSAAVNARAVGAVNYFNQQNPASFTSAGPTTILFNPDGTRKATPDVRLKPEFSALQGTDTTFFGSSDFEGNGFPNFFGTSAAAPHAAAIAALVKQANPSFTSQQIIYQRLESTATDIGTPGRDDLTGIGLINAYDAVFGKPVPAQLNFFDDFENGDLPIAFETRTFGAGQIQVTNQNGPIGTRHVTLDSSVGLTTKSLNELILHVDTTDKSNVLLSFDQKEFNDEDDLMPETFSGSVGADGVALSVNGIDWYRIVDLTGANSTNTYQNKTVDLSQFAASKGISLGNNVRIKFQQFNNATIPSDGFAFDNISVTGTAKIVGINLDGTSNDDNLTGTEGNDTIRGFNAQDILNGLGGDDFLDGGDGDDKLFGGQGNDSLLGGSGQDQLFGEAGNDMLDGGDGDDTLFGGEGNDTLYGGQGQDQLFGDAGDDILIGGAGDNTLSGGIGKDTFVLSTEGKNNITDFQIGQDLIGLTSGLTFASLNFTAQNGGTWIYTSNNQPLAFLVNVNPNLLTAKDFTFV